MQILSGLILLAVLIVFHELGHFLFAKMLGVKVLVFSLGFGPKIWGFKRGDTEYRISALPLGGYVRMFGESLEEELTPEEKKQSFIHQAIWRKSLIAFAGPLFNFVLPIILFFCLAFGVEQVYAPIVGTLLKDSVAEKAGLLPDDRIVAVDGEPVSSFSELAHHISEHPNQSMALRIARPQREGGSLEVNLDIRPEARPSPTPFDKDKMVGRIGIMPAIEKAVVVIDPKSALHAAGVNNFDEIVSINDKPIVSMYALQSMLRDLKPGSSIGLKRPELVVVTVPANNLGATKPESRVVNNLPAEEKLEAKEHKALEQSKNILQSEATAQAQHWGLASAIGVVVKVEPSSLAETLNISPNDRVVALNGEKISSSHHLQQGLLQDIKSPKILGLIKADGEAIIQIFSLPSDLEEKLKLDPELSHVIGLTLADVYKPGEAFERSVGVGEAFKRACLQTWSLVAMTGQSLWMLISGAVPASQVGGPIMIFDVAQQAAQKGLPYYIFIMCLLSVNLGLLNLLPIPALDGGHLLLFGIEAVQRKPLTPKTRAIATQIGLVLLLALMGLAIFNDLYRLFK